MTVKTIQRSFAGGVATPEMFARFDLTKNQTGLAEAINFEVLPHGPVANSPGFAYVLEVQDSSKLTVLIPFIYSTSQSMVLEFGDQYLRFHTQGGTLLEAAQAITAATVASPGVFTAAAHGFTTGRWVFAAGLLGSGFTSLNNRFFKVTVLTVNTFSLSDLAGVAVSTLGFSAYGGGGTVSRVYQITTPYTPEHLYALHYAQSADVLTLTHPNYQQRELRRLGATNWTLTPLAFAPTIAAPAAPTAVATVAVGASITYTYCTTALLAGTLEESYASPTDDAVNKLTTAGNYNTITPAPVAGAVRYNVYREVNGLFGFIGQTDGSDLIDENITPDATRTPPVADGVMALASNYPAAVGYLQGRRWFAGTLAEPQRVLATRSGTESNFSYSIPSQEDDRLSFKIAARQANTVRHIVPLEDLVLLTSGNVYVVGSSTGGAITRTTVDPRPKPSVGANDAQPAVTQHSILYACDRGGRVCEFAYRGDQSGGYRGADISLVAPHLFDGYTINQIAFRQAPHPTAFFVRSDGTLLGLTYVPEQQVAGWHTRTTVNGFFESACVVPEGSEDVLYVVVRRVVNGRTVRYVERRHTRAFATLADAFFVDSGITYDGAAATTFTGLDHLNGETVSVLADGAVWRDKVVGAVTGGIGITLDEPASKVIIGLPITSRFKTLPLATEAAPAAGQGALKNINSVSLRVHESSGLSVGPAYDKLRQVKQRTTENPGTPPELISREARVMLVPNWNTEGHVCVEQTDPLPVTVLSMTIEAAYGG